jgi:hypothetical protein
MATKEKEKLDQYYLSANDRCDRCTAQAYVRATGVSGELYFCGHHYTAFNSTLSKWAFEIIDEREKLVENKLVD